MGFSSLYVGASGLIAHETGMQVVSNNLANVSTTGYKKTNAQFGDLISQQLATGGAQYDSGANAISQIGKGVAVADVRGIFTSGSIENSNSATDLAISGQGYFGTRNTAKGFQGPPSTRALVTSCLTRTASWSTPTTSGCRGTP